MYINRNASPIVLDCGRTILEKCDGYVLCEPSQPFVRRIVDDFDQRMVGIDWIGIHPWPVEDWRKILQDLDVLGVIIAIFCYHNPLNPYIWGPYRSP